MTTVTRLLTAAALLPLLGAPALAADLKKLDRTIAKEPAYATKQPKYCLLVFGPEAQTRVWLVADGDFLHVDRNGNGDLTEPGERVRFSPFEQSGLSFVDEQRDVDAGDLFEGKLKHEHLRVTQQRVKKGFVTKERWEEELKALAERDGDALICDVSLSLEIRPRPGDPIRIAGRISQSAGMDGEGFLQFADSPREAPIIHYRGPLQMGLHSPQRLTLGPEPCDLKTVVGTPGVGPGTFASVGYTGLIAADAKPVAEIAFPPAAPGGSPLKAQYVLTHRC